MSLGIGDNFKYQGKKPNFERDSFALKAEMKAFPEANIDEGHLSFCKEDGKRYEFRSSNSVDPNTGKWREFKTSADLSGYPTKTEMQKALLNNITDYNVSKHHPTEGIGGTNKFTLESAIKLIPESLRSVGIKCSFLDNAENINIFTYDGTRWVRDNNAEYERIEKSIFKGNSSVGDANITIYPRNNTPVIVPLPIQRDVLYEISIKAFGLKTEVYASLTHADGNLTYIATLSPETTDCSRTYSTSRDVSDAFIKITNSFAPDKYEISIYRKSIYDILNNEKKATSDKLSKTSRHISDILGTLSERSVVPVAKTDNGILLDDGSVKEYEGYAIRYHNITEGKVYCINGSIEGDGFSTVHYFNKAGECIGMNYPLFGSKRFFKNEILMIPSGTAKIGINVQTLKTIELYESSIVNDIAESVELNSHRLKGKTVVCFGDSITEMNDDSGKRWTDYFAEQTGAVVYNAGIAGSQLSMRVHTVKLKITGKATSNGSVTVSIGTGIITNITTEDTVESIAKKLEEASNSGFVFAVGDTLYSYVWDNPKQWRNAAKCMVSTNTGISYQFMENSWVGLPDTNVKDTNAAYSAMDIPAMVCGLVEGDWSAQSAAADFLKSLDDNTSIIQTMSKVSIDNVDAVVIFGGTNNYAEESFGTNDGVPANSLSWHLGMCIEKLLTRKPSLEIIVLTPICRYFGNDISKWDDSKWCDNHKYDGRDFIAMTTLVDAVKKVTEKYHVKVVDMYSHLGWNKYNYSNYFNNGDGTHPKKGLKYLADYISQRV